MTSSLFARAKSATRPSKPEPGLQSRLLFTVRGIPIRAEATLWIIALLVMWSFWSRFATTDSGVTAVAMAIASAALFLGSILAHEIAHALEAKRRGLTVQDVTLYVFGGATRITSDIKRPGDEFALTIVGPWASIVLGCGFGLVAYGAASAGIGTIADVAGQLGWLNVFLGVFNLLPGAPLDGGRLLEATVWRFTRDRSRATAASTRTGQVLGTLIVIFGLNELLFVTGGFIGGLWLMLIGWFLVKAAGAERLMASVRTRLAGRRAGDIASPLAAGVPLGSALSEAVSAAVRVGQTDLIAVTGADGEMVGVIALGDLKRFEPNARWQIPVEDVMTPVDELEAIDASAPAEELLPLLGAKPAVVRAGTSVVGAVTNERLMSALPWLALANNERATIASTDVATQHTNARDRGSIGRRGLWAASGALAFASLLVVPMPLFEIAPGPAIDLPSNLIIYGHRHPVAGKLLLTSVTISSPSAFGIAGAVFAPDRELLGRSSLIPPGIDPAAYEASQIQVFRDSIQLAAALALREAGYPVRIDGGGAIVRAVGSGGPADSKLQPGDVITRVGGQQIASSADLVARLRSSVAGAALRLQVLRGGRSIGLSVAPETSSALDRPALDIAVEDAAPFVTLPFSVRVTRSDIGGPSAGLMAALSVYSLTTGTNLTHGRTVAGTGTIDREGTVGRVGGVAEKVLAAANNGATVFLVPTADAAIARRAASGHGIEVISVDSLKGAIAALNNSSGSK